jgi:hypothetical protein
MMTEMNTTEAKYSLRLLGRYVWYDINGSQLWREWAKNQIVTDPEEIALLESKGAPAERIIET